MLYRLRQWRAILTIFLLDGIAYPATGLIWVLTDGVTAFTMPLVFAAAAQGGAIKGFAAADFFVYYLSLLMISSFVTCHFMWEISFEIKEGRFSAYLVRPISFFQYMFLRNLAWRCVRFLLTVPLFTVLLIGFSSHLKTHVLYTGWEFWLGVLLGHTVSVTVVLALSMLALFVEETTSIFELYYVPMLFLSGHLFPIVMLPDWARNLAKLFPFYYTTGGPTEILIGKVQGPDIYSILLAQVVWILIAYVAHKLLWRVGLQYYTGVGM